MMWCARERELQAEVGPELGVRLLVRDPFAKSESTLSPSISAGNSGAGSLATLPDVDRWALNQKVELGLALSPEEGDVAQVSSD
jgi:hypothetical protein